MIISDFCDLSYIQDCHLPICNIITKVSVLYGNSHLTLYSDTLGTVTAIHFRKICKNTRKGSCNAVQYYGYHSEKVGEVVYDEHWKELPYFISSRETVFETKILSQLDAEILIRTLSYKQRAEIYNYIHGYEQVTKENVSDQG